MAKTIVIRKRSWLERHPIQIRRLLVRLIFSEATRYGYEIVMEGQRWRDSAQPTLKDDASQVHTMTDQEWAMLMGHQ